MNEDLKMNKELTFNEEKHEYYLGERKLLHVTEILDQAGLTNYSCTDNYYLERGSAIHKACQYHDEHDLDESTLDPVIIPYLKGWKKFISENDIIFHAIEAKVASEAWGYAGTLDRFASIKIHGNIYNVILDIKTGAVNAWDALQLVAYELTDDVKNDYGNTFIKRCVVQLTNLETYKLHWFSGRNDRNVFLSGLACVNWKKNNLNRGM